MKTLLHIDGDPIWAEAIHRMTAESGLVRHVGSRSTLTTAVATCRALAPDIVLMELDLPDGTGREAIQQILTFHPPARILLLTHRTDEATLLILRTMPIAGMIAKDAAVKENFSQALVAVRAGQCFVTTEIAAACVRLMQRTDTYTNLLSAREQEILPALGEGHSDAEIARRYGLNRLTVKSHRARIMRKLQLHRTEDLMRWAFEKGVVFWRPLPLVPLRPQPAATPGIPEVA